jgi:hypothetical protein
MDPSQNQSLNPHDEHDDERPQWRADEHTDEETAATSDGRTESVTSDDRTDGFRCDDPDSLCDTDGHELVE